ncbi:MAG: chromate transporter, partial [Candidatus Humimicrobiaceae bacterium]
MGKKQQIDGSKIKKEIKRNSELSAGDAILKKALNFFFFFFKLGFMAYGGPAMLGFIKKEVVYKRNLITEDDYN